MSVVTHRARQFLVTKSRRSSAEVNVCDCGEEVLKDCLDLPLVNTVSELLWMDSSFSVSWDPFPSSCCKYICLKS